MTTGPIARPHTPAPDLGLTVLRVAIGLIFLMHGIQKLFVFTLPGTTDAFAQMGVPLPGLSAPLVAFAELLGGAALIAGLFTRWAAAALAVNILVALFLVHLKGGFFAPNGVEFPLALFAGSVALALTGAGRYALDTLIHSRRRV